MSQGNIAVTMRVRCPLGAQEQNLWDSLIPEFTQEVLYPSCVRLVITDRYEEIAGTYAVQSASQLNQAEIAADYRSAKPGGAVAVAKTVDLPDDKVAVIVDAGLAKLGREVMRRTLLHEAQHVCLIQNADSAMAVHKRVALKIRREVRVARLVARPARTPRRCAGQTACSTCPPYTSGSSGWNASASRLNSWNPGSASCSLCSA
jgi:hypothetical protein